MARHRLHRPRGLALSASRDHGHGYRGDHSPAGGAVMSAQIFQFANAPRRLEKIKTSTRVGEDIGDNLPAEIDFRSPGWKARQAERAANRPATAINSDLRKERRTAWRAAEAA